MLLMLDISKCVCLFACVCLVTHVGISSHLELFVVHVLVYCVL